MNENIKVIGLSGFAGSGKDFIATYFFRPMGFFKVALANGFKHKVVGRGQLYDEVFTSGEKNDTTRHLLQQEGTERGRDIYGKDIWIKTLESFMKWNYTHNDIDKYIISDVRFHNEINWIKSVGKVIWIKSDRMYKLQGGLSTHPSEAEMREVPKDKWDYIIINNKDTSLEHLHRQVDQFIIKSGWNGMEAMKK